MTTLTIASTQDELIAEIERLRSDLKITAPKNEAWLPTIQKKNLLHIITELQIQAKDTEDNLADATYRLQHPKDFDPITDPPVTRAELDRVRAKIATTIDDLITQLRDTNTTTAERKKIRARLRHMGFKLSEQKHPAALTDAEKLKIDQDEAAYQTKKAALEYEFDR